MSPGRFRFKTQLHSWSQSWKFDFEIWQNLLGMAKLKSSITTIDRAKAEVSKSRAAKKAAKKKAPAKAQAPKKQ
jgi:hypothetical protein